MRCEQGRPSPAPPPALWLPAISQSPGSGSHRAGQTAPCICAGAKLTNLPFYFEPSLKALQQFLIAKFSAPIVKALKGCLFPSIPLASFDQWPPLWPGLCFCGCSPVCFEGSSSRHLHSAMVSNLNVKQVCWLPFPLGGFRSWQNPECGLLFIFSCGCHKLRVIVISVIICWKLRCWIVTMYVPEYLYHLRDFWKQNLRRKLLKVESQWSKHFNEVSFVPLKSCLWVPRDHRMNPTLPFSFPGSSSCSQQQITSPGSRWG